MEIFQDFLTFIKTFKSSLKKKHAAYGAALLFLVLVGAFFLFRNGKDKEETLVVHPGDFVQQVSVSGKVVAAEHVDLVFSQSGRVAAVYAKVGDTVFAGKVLAALENGDAWGEVLQKEAARDAAEAKFAALQVGTRSEELAVTESEVFDAETVLARANQTLVDALKKAYTESDDAVRRRVDQFMSNPRSADPKLNFTVTNQLQSDVEWRRFLIESMFVTWASSLDFLNVNAGLGAHIATAMKNLDEVRTFLDKVALAVNSVSASPSLSQATIDGYRADVTTARTNISGAITALTSAVTGQENALADIATAKRNLELEKAGATKEALQEEEARVKSAEAELASARARFRKTLVVAPFTGVITKMDVKVGGTASSNTSDIAMISAGTLQMESFVPEINIPLLALGDEAVATLDAYGPAAPFAAKVISIDPAETVRDGVSTYRVKLQFDASDERIRPGMTANILIVTEKKSNVIAVPQGIVTERDGQKFVSVKEGDSIVDRVVQTGSVSSLGTIEIVSGLTDGDIVLLKSEEE